MAKWGEGDERWIVQEREDGANVNGWHWEEKQRMHWMQERIPQMLHGLQADSAQDIAAIRVKEVTSIKGDVRLLLLMSHAPAETVAHRPASYKPVGTSIRFVLADL